MFDGFVAKFLKDVRTIRRKYDKFETEAICRHSERLAKKSAFTLAEVLITLGIIGVVAALTIPSLLENYEKRTTATAVKKAYSELTQALSNAEAEYGDMQNWDYPQSGEYEENEKFVKKYIIPYYKGVTMMKEGVDPTWGTGVSLAGTNFKSSNGTIFSIRILTNKVIYILIDVNGLKKPNQMGTDMFYFDTDTGALMPSGWKAGLTREMLLNGTGLIRCKSTFNENEPNELPRHGCTALLMLDGWEFKKDYPWKFNSGRAF